MNKIKLEVKRYLRGLTSLLRYIFVERPRGLDFSLRQKTIGITHKNNNGYALTPKKSFDQVIKFIDNPSQHDFIDIGCGKGGVLYFAKEYGFNKVAGIEIEDSLYEIAVNNFKKLNLDVSLYHSDALTFENYNNYSVFFLFNPFPKNIYENCLKKIIEGLEIREEKRREEKRREEKRIRYIIAYGGSYCELLDKNDLFELIAEFIEPVRPAHVRIYKTKREL